MSRMWFPISLCIWLVGLTNNIGIRAQLLAVQSLSIHETKVFSTGHNNHHDDDDDDDDYDQFSV